ncbi:hypothetical protein PJI20_10040 [Mycobacterium kansasii]
MSWTPKSPLAQVWAGDNEAPARDFASPAIGGQAHAVAVGGAAHRYTAAPAVCAPGGGDLDVGADQHEGGEPPRVIVQSTRIVGADEVVQIQV